MIKTYMKAILAASVTIIGLQTNVSPADAAGFEIKIDTLFDQGQPDAVALHDMHDAEHQNEEITIEEIALQPHAKDILELTAEETEAKTDHEALIPVEAKKKEEKTEIDLSKEERNLLARLVEAEAKGESFEGKVAVAEVVINRVESPEFPNSVEDVIYEVVGSAYAFSPVQNGAIKKPASEESKRAVKEALTSENGLDGTVYFYNPDIATDNWIRTRDVVKKIDNHVFAK